MVKFLHEYFFFGLLTLFIGEMFFPKPGKVRELRSILKSKGNEVTS